MEKTVQGWSILKKDNRINSKLTVCFRVPNSGGLFEFAVINEPMGKHQVVKSKTCVDYILGSTWCEGQMNNTPVVNDY